MNTFWSKIIVLAIVVLVLVVLVNNLSERIKKPKTKPKTFQSVIAEDDRRLRADIEPPIQTRQQPTAESAAEASKPQPQKIPIEDQVQAERLFEMALTERKMARLPGVDYKRMVDYCREIIKKFPQTSFAPKARRMLGEVPKQYWKRYGITEEEVNPSN